MTLRIQPLVLRGWSSRQCPRCPIAITIRRSLSSYSSRDQTRFSFVTPAGKTIENGELFKRLREAPALANNNNHNAAVILATPDLVRHLEDDEFMNKFVMAMSGRGDIERFHVLSAVVDHIAPPLGTYTPLRGISVLRGHLEDILPHLWQPSAPRSREDADKVAALNFSLGDPSITLPLTRTTFHNHKTSTLLTSLFDMSSGGLKLTKRVEKVSQTVNISLSNGERPQSIGDLGLWAPLTPITRARIVTESFGNIVRGVEVDGESIPASTELETAVNTAYEHASATQKFSGPVGVWALITPGSYPVGEGPSPTQDFLTASEDQKDVAEYTSNYARDAYKEGGRLYKILSGGGGWGPKKGLLSLDPQQTHFSLSDEEEMQKFLQTMDNSGFAPVGSSIQFFTSMQGDLDTTERFEPGVIFGIPGSCSVPSEKQGEPPGGLIGQHFGALSNDGIFVSGSDSSKRNSEHERDQSKLGVPHSRVYMLEDGNDAGIVGSLPIWTVADAGVTAMI